MRGAFIQVHVIIYSRRSFIEVLQFQIQDTMQKVILTMICISLPLCWLVGLVGFYFTLKRLYLFNVLLRTEPWAIAYLQ